MEVLKMKSHFKFTKKRTIKLLSSIGFSLSLLLFSPIVSAAEHLDGKYISELIFNDNGTIQVAVYLNGRSGPPYLCDPNYPHDPFMGVFQCTSESNITKCTASQNRIASMLLIAHMSAKPVTLILGSPCIITRVLIKN